MRADGQIDTDMTNIIVAFRSFSEHANNFYALLTQCIYVFCMDLRTSTDYVDAELRLCLITEMEFTARYGLGI